MTSRNPSAPWTISWFFILCAFVSVSLPSRVRADQEEQGLSYACNSELQELRISSVMSGGGESFVEFEKEDSGFWNIDRMDKAVLPIIKTCHLGQHKVSVVISLGCIAGNGFSPRVSLYGNAEVSVGEGRSVKVTGAHLREDGYHPFAEAEFFGSYCDPAGALSFSDIVVRLRGTDRKSLAVSMQ